MDNQKIENLGREDFYKSLFMDNRQIMFLINPDTSEVLECNQAACEYFGHSYDQMLNIKFRELLAEIDTSDIEVHPSPLRVGEEELLFLMIKEISKLNRMLEESYAFNKVILDCLPGLVFVYNEEGHLVKWNRAHEEMTGYTGRELTEMPLENWFQPKEAKRVAAAAEEIFKNGQGEMEAQMIMKDGRKRLIKSYASRFNIQEENFFAGIGIDITRQREIEEKIKESERQFRRSVENSPVPVMLHSEDGKVLKLSDSWTDATGYTLKDIPTTEIWAGKAYGKDKDRILKIIDGVYLLKGKQYDGECRVRTKSGKILVWDFYSSFVGKTADGKRFFKSVAIDVTLRDKLEHDLAHERNFLKTTLLSVGDGVIASDVKGNVTFMNYIAESLTGWQMTEAIGKPLEEVYHVGEGKILISRDKIERPIESTMAPILGRNGKTVGVVIVFRDFTATMEKLNQVEYLSYHDKLTGLYNRRFYEEEVRRLDTERNLPLSIIMGDVNGLKLINDSFGHLVGDELLRKVADVLKNACRNDEIIARLGGDEFVILLPKTDETEAEVIINRLKRMNSLEEVNSLDVSVAFGAATKLDPEDDPWEVLKRAEEKMYQGKLFESPKVKERTLKRIIEIYNEINRIEGARLEKMCQLCEGMGSSIGLDRHELEKLRRACTLHDIGKVAIDDRLFKKTDKLTPEDWEEVQKHSEIGYRILSTMNELAEMAEYVLYHHEKWDGNGYPKGLKGKDIPVESRILAIVDAYDAMTSERRYREPLSEEEAIQELETNAGTQFDPGLIRTFLERLKEEDEK